jgi:hypothetical protein
MVDRRAIAKIAPEESLLFNQAFLGSLGYEFVRTYSKERDRAPITLLAIALAAALHKQTRTRLPYSTVSSLYGWLQDNEPLLVGFNRRARGLLPYVKRAALFALNQDTLSLAGGHYLKLGRNRASFTASFLQTTTYETQDIVDRTRFLARWFAKSGSEASVMAAWGLKP